MAANTVDVEPVADVESPSQPIDRVGPGLQASTVYELQLAFMAARIASLEDELDVERARRQRVRNRYERLLAERDEELADLRGENADGLLAELFD